MIAIVGPRDRNKYAGWVVVNTTSSSANWSKGLSPMYLGPVTLYDGYEAKNVENGWQFSKVYRQHLLSNGEVSPAYWQWATQGWEDAWAHRYPMGKGARPEFSLWQGQRLGYVAARKAIYVPLYAAAVRKTPAYQQLAALYRQHQKLVLFDFDGYDYLGLGLTLMEVLDNPDRKMGHAFVLAMMLTGQI